MNIFDTYRLLQCHPGSTDAEIKHAHRLRSRETHPDRHPGKEAEFTDIQLAYRQVSTGAGRRQLKLKLSGLGRGCHACGERGYTMKQTTILSREFRPCLDCGACGYIPHAR